MPLHSVLHPSAQPSFLRLSIEVVFHFLRTSASRCHVILPSPSIVSHVPIYLTRMSFSNLILNLSHANFSSDAIVPYCISFWCMQIQWSISNSANSFCVQIDTWQLNTPDVQHCQPYYYCLEKKNSHVIELIKLNSPLDESNLLNEHITDWTSWVCSKALVWSLHWHLQGSPLVQLFSTWVNLVILQFLVVPQKICHLTCPNPPRRRPIS